MRWWSAVALAVGLVGCSAWGAGTGQGTAPPPEGWAAVAPTRVEAVVPRGEHELLAVSQGALRTWVQVPAVGAEVGAYVLLGQGTVRTDVPVPERQMVAPVVVDIAHVAVVDQATAERVASTRRPAEAVDIGTVYAELDARADQEVIVEGTVVKAAHAVGWTWVHLRDGTGEAAAGTHDLTVKTKVPVAVGERVSFRGVLRADVDLGFGYHYAALVEGGERVSAGAGNAAGS